MDRDTEVTAAYGEMAARWDTAGAAWNQPVARRLVELAALEPPMRVLDAGCGAGAVSIPAGQAVAGGGYVTGIDTAPAMLSRARLAAAQAGLSNVRFRLGDAAAPVFARGSFDAVLASLVVYLLPGGRGALEQWRQLLAAEGLVGFTWVVAEDPAFEPAFAAVDAYLPRGQQGWGALTSAPPWNSVTSAEAMLIRYASVTTVIESVTTVYRSPDHFWESSWTQGPALVWRHIPPALREEARVAAMAALKPEPDGTLHRTRQVCYTLARVSHQA